LLYTYYNESTCDILPRHIFEPVLGGMKKFGEFWSSASSYCMQTNICPNLSWAKLNKNKVITGNSILELGV